MKSWRKTYLAAAAAAALIFAGLYVAGCGGGGGGDAGGDTGTLTVSVADAPVDVANRVVVIFNGVVIQPAEGDSITYVFSEDKAIDLLALTGGESAVILNSVVLDAGQYNWIRLSVKSDRDVIESFIELDDLTVWPLYVPSGDETGLKLNTPFTVPAGGEADFTIDFDLRKSVHNPEGGDYYILRPTLRIVDNTEVGSIAGIVNGTLLDPGGGNAVYVYEGPGVAPDDVGSATEPVNTAIVEESGEYRVGLLVAGVYTVAFTNQADMDDPSTDDGVVFLQPANVSVASGATTTHNIQ